MRIRAPRLVVASLAVASLAVTATASAQPTSAPAGAPVSLPAVTLPPELDRVLRDYERAWGARDAGALSALFAEDGFVLQGGRAPVRGRAAIREAYRGSGGPLRLYAFAFARAGDVGYILGGYGEPGTTGDEGKFTLTLRRDRGGRWLIVSDMDNANRRPRW